MELIEEGTGGAVTMTMTVIFLLVVAAVCFFPFPTLDIFLPTLGLISSVFEIPSDIQYHSGLFGVLFYKIIRTLLRSHPYFL